MFIIKREKHFQKAIRTCNEQLYTYFFYTRHEYYIFDIIPFIINEKEMFRVNYKQRTLLRVKVK